MPKRRESIRCWPGSSCETVQNIPVRWWRVWLPTHPFRTVLIGDTLPELTAQLPPGLVRSVPQKRRIVST